MFRHETDGVSDRFRLLWSVDVANNNKFVFVSFWGGVIVVDYRHARVDEEQGEGGQAGRENVA